MDPKIRKFAETIKNHMANELSDETLTMIWGWHNRVQKETCATCEKEERIDLLREMIDELTRDAMARKLVNQIKDKAINDETGNNE